MSLTVPKRKKGLPDGEHVPTLDERETEELIRRFKRQLMKEKILPSQKQFKTHFKRALPDAYVAAQEFSKNMHAMNPEHRKSLARATREAIHGD